MSGFDDNPFGHVTSSENTYGLRTTIPQPVNTVEYPSSNPFSENTLEVSSSASEIFNGNVETIEKPANAWTASSIDTDHGKGVDNQSTNPSMSKDITSAKEAIADIFTIDVDRRAGLERQYESLDDVSINDTTTTNIDKKNNWPSFPAWTRIKPCFYHDIDVDIPFQYQRIVKSLYRIWIGYVLVLSLNMVDGLIALFIGFSDDNGKAVGLALLYWAFCIPASFVCWFRPAYKAFRNDGSIRFMIFFFVFFAQCAFSIFISLGIGDIGAFGWVNGIDQFTKGTATNYFFGCCCILTGLCSTFIAVCSIFMIIKIHQLYRYSGNSMQKAKDEMVSGIKNNKTVQDAAVSATTSIVTNQSQGQT